jgi:hypothetical protein
MTYRGLATALFRLGRGRSRQSSRRRRSTRLLDVVRRDVDTAQYAALRSLFGAVETSDGLKLVLIRRP